MSGGVEERRLEDGSPAAVASRGRVAWGETLFIGALAAFTGAGAWVETQYSSRSVPPVAGALALTFAAAVVLVGRRRWPVRVAVAVLVLTVGYHLLGYDGLAPGLLMYAACYALPVYAGRRGLWLGLAAAAVVWVAPTLPPDGLAWYEFDVSIPAMGVAVAAGVGESARRRRAEAREQVRRSAEMAREHTARRLAEERLRIARELHDVLAHTISVVVVQSGLALDALEDDPVQSRAAMLVVRAAARQAMPELRAALELLRGAERTGKGTEEGAGEAEMRPQPGLGQLAELVAGFRGSGMAVELGAEVEAGDGAGEVDGEVPAVVQLTAYRIIQESLTNALRHANAERVVVSVRRRGEALDVEMVDDGVGRMGRGTGVDAGGGSGFGLLGMRERAEAVGGVVEAGPGEGGGFRVVARLPLDAHRAQPDGVDATGDAS